jgi:hypothetical protein
MWMLENVLHRSNIYIDLDKKKEQKSKSPQTFPQGNTSLIAEPLNKLSARPDRPPSSRVQGKHSHLPPRGCPPGKASVPQRQPFQRIVAEAHCFPTDTPSELADDLLRGADEIAAFIFGDRESRRKVYYLAECCRLPVFRLGSMLCARQSVLLNWISGQESRVSHRLTVPRRLARRCS